MTKLPGFSASSPVVVGDRLFAACGTSDLVCLSKKDGRILWLTTCTPCDAAGAAEQAAAGYQDKVMPLAAELRKANDTLLKEMNAANPLPGLPQDQQGKLDGLIRQKHDLEKKLHDALRSIDGKKYPQLYINEVAGTNGTPITDGKRVYVAVGGGSKGPGAYVISAYSLEGERLWSFHEALGAAEHGNHASPALLDGKLIYGVMDTLIAFDAASGKVAWRTKVPKDTPHYWDAMNESACTYVPTRIMGTAVLVAAPGRIVRVADGQLLSKDNGESVFTGMSTPLVANGMLFADGGKELLAEQLPATADGSLKPSWKIEEKRWRMDGSSRFSIASALAVNGLYYSLDTMGALTAIDLASQKTLFVRRLELYQRANRQTFGFTASPTLGGKNLYVFDNTGCAVLLEPGQSYKEVGRNIIENQVVNEWWAYKQENFYASPVFDDKAIFLKGSEYLYCLRQP